jgi:hypothetical protein
MMRTIDPRRACILLACLLLPLFAHAHKASDAYVTLARDGSALRGQWDIALRDLDAAIGLDANGDGEITWGELRRKQSEIAAYALARFRVSSDGADCALRPGRQLVDSHTDGTYAVLTFTGECPHVAPTLTIDYRLFRETDPQHRGLLNFVHDGRSESLVFGAENSRRVVGTHSALVQMGTYLNEGTWHIWLGFDHILFLVSLLLPAVFVRDRSGWRAGATFGTAFVDVAKVVTAFTVAHSITLSLAALSIVELPSRFVESAIAASVVLAAINNVFPVVANRRWIAAFAFGLLHGFGFAGALHDLGLPTSSLALSLASFNIGVELGQLAIVLPFLPIAFLLRGTTLYRRVIFVGGSMAIATLASVWLVERAFDVDVLTIVARAS